MTYLGISPGPDDGLDLRMHCPITYSYEATPLTMGTAVPSFEPPVVSGLKQKYALHGDFLR